MRIILATLLFIFAGLYLAIVISIGICAGLKMWEKRKNEDNQNN